MLLEPRCNCSINRSQHPSQPYLDEPASGSFFVVSQQDKAASSAPKSCPREDLALWQLILVRIFGLQQHDSHFFWDTLKKKVMAYIAHFL